MRFRLFLISLGAILVAATFSFPLWIELFQNEQTGAPEEVFPGLSARLQELFPSLPPDQQAAYRQVAVADRADAVAMIQAALAPPIPAPTEQVELPQMTGAQSVATGSFTRLDAIRWAQGRLTIYQQVDNSKILRFEEFSVVNGPALRVALATTPPEDTSDEEEATPTSPIEYIVTGGLDLGPLIGTTGNQNYDIPAEVDITQFDSVVIYSPSLEMIYSIAPLVM